MSWKVYWRKLLWPEIQCQDLLEKAEENQESVPIMIEDERTYVEPGFYKYEPKPTATPTR
jgi:hypothetical protein